jgi:hypothetical protein
MLNKRLDRWNVRFSSVATLLVISSGFALALILGWRPTVVHRDLFVGASAPVAAESTVTSSASRVLSISEWGVDLPLPTSVGDAYYTVAGSNVGSDGVPNTAWIGMTSTDTVGCNIAGKGPGSGASPVGAFLRVALTDRDPVSGNLYTDQFPAGVTIGKYYYVYKTWADRPCMSGKSDQTIDTSFGNAVKAATKSASATY